jgi:hypothetical protein
MLARSAVAEPGLSVETGSPDALCPDLAATRSAVRDRIGQLSLDGPSSWVARYTIGHTPNGGGDFVILVLKDDSGAIRLERRLPLAGESCETVVQAIALVLERYFRELQAPSEPTTAPAAIEPVPPAAASAPEPSPALEPMRAPALQLALEGGLALGPRTAVFGLELGAWFAGWFHASFQPQLLVPSVGETIRDGLKGVRGSADVLELPFRASFGVGRRLERWAWHVGPALRVSLRNAASDDLVVRVDGESQSGSSAMGWAIAAGASAGVTYWVLPSLGLTGAVALDAQIAETRFEVEESSGAGRTLLASPSPQGQALIGVTFAVRP